MGEFGHIGGVNLSRAGDFYLSLELARQSMSEHNQLDSRPTPANLIMTNGWRASILRECWGIGNLGKDIHNLMTKFFRY